MIAAFLFLLAHAGQTTEAPVQVGPWQIAQRETSCSLDTSFRSGTLVRIEYFPRQDDYFLLLANPSWPQIVDGRRYRIDIRSDRNFVLPLEGRGVREEGASHVAMYIPVVPRRHARHLDPKRYLEDILLGDQEMNIGREGRPWLSLRLSDTGPAFEALGRCADRLAPQERSPLSTRLANRDLPFNEPTPRF